MINRRKDLSRSARGQGLAEYALLVVLVVVVLLLALAATGTSFSDIYNSIIEALGFDGGCETVAGSSMDEWTALKDKFWRGGITDTGDQLTVCPLCGGVLDGYTGSDYVVDLSDVQVTNTGSTWYGYGVTFRSEYTNRGLNGYMFEIEQTNKNKPPVMYFSKWVNGNQVRPSLAVTNLPANFSWSDPPDMQVSVQGDTFVAYLDGVPVLNASDSTYASGSAGVIANAGSTLRFSDFSLNPTDCLESEP